MRGTRIITAMCAVIIWRKDDTHKQLLDGFEGGQLGEFLFSSGKVAVCDVKLPSGERKQCNSLPEFNNLIIGYMK
jgi:hypothetical protein